MTVHPADTALLVTRALRRGSAVLAVLAGWAAVSHGGAIESELRARGVDEATAHAVSLQHAGVLLVVGLAAVLVLHLLVGARVRRGLAARVEREWAAVEPRWSRPGAP